MNNLSYKISKEDTLLFFKRGNTDLFFPFRKGALDRGGAFWCLPNFDDDGPPFTIRHGEYRKTEGEQGERDSMTKNLSGPWGNLITKSSWEFGETGMKTTLFLLSPSSETYIRPGFHPYFNTEDGESLLSITVGESIFLRADLRENTKMIVPAECVGGSCAATLMYQNSEIVLRFTVVSESEKRGHAFAFCIWTDNLSRYVCIEPVLGSQELKEGLPDSFLLANGESITLSISVDITY
jgi:galactose mutarotase-like enzyme